MTTIINHGELVRRAFSYIENERREHPEMLERLLDEAAMRFNLSPLESEALQRLCSGVVVSELAHGSEPA